MTRYSIMNTHTDPITFGAGVFVNDAADELAALVRETGNEQRAEFNDTPMVGKPGDLPRHILERWHYERRIYQLERGIA